MTDEEILALIKQINASTTSGAGGQQTGGDTNYTQGTIGNVPATSGTPSGIPAGTNPMEFFLRQTPGYQFAFDEGQRAVQTSAFSRGVGRTGGTMKALARFGTGLADQTYGNTVNRFLSLADLGQRTAVAPF